MLTETSERLSAAAKYKRESDEIAAASKWCESEVAKLLIEAHYECGEYAVKFRLAYYSVNPGEEHDAADTYAAEFRKMQRGIEKELSTLRDAAIRDECCIDEDDDDYEDDAERYVTSVQDAIRNWRRA
jgi:hypothetical protein